MWLRDEKFRILPNVIEWLPFPPLVCRLALDQSVYSCNVLYSRNILYAPFRIHMVSSDTWNACNKIELQSAFQA